MKLTITFLHLGIYFIMTCESNSLLTKILFYFKYTEEFNRSTIIHSRVSIALQTVSV